MSGDRKQGLNFSDKVDRRRSLEPRPRRPGSCSSSQNW